MQPLRSDVQSNIGGALIRYDNFPLSETASLTVDVPEMQTEDN